MICNICAIFGVAMYLLRWFYVNVNFILRSFILVFALFGNKITMRDGVRLLCDVCNGCVVMAVALTLNETSIYGLIVRVNDLGLLTLYNWRKTNGANKEDSDPLI